MTPCPHCGAEHDATLRYCPATGKLVSAERIFPPGTELEGKYRLGKAIGMGGMGAVFEATHLLLGRRVAIKLLLPEYAQDAEICARLLREARAASATGHRNIAQVTDVGQAGDGTLFLVMEYVAGRTLRQLVNDEGPLGVARAVGIVDQVLSALEVVHRKGIVHRDLKPSNVLVQIDDEGEEIVKILDFGISKVRSDALSMTELTTRGRVMGTPKYMSPEQATGEADVDQRADLYTVGAMLYELLTGKPPLTAQSYNAMVALLLHGVIAPPSERAPRVPPELDRVVLKALARRREDRYPDAAALRRALLPFAAWDSESTQQGIPAPGLRLDLAPEGAMLAGAEASTTPPTLRRVLPREAHPAHASAEPRPPAAGPTVEPRSAASRPPARQEAPPLERLEIEPALLPAVDAPSREKAPVAEQTIYRPVASGGPRWVRLLLVGCVLAVLAALVWHFRPAIWGLLGRSPPAAEWVSLHVRTDPPEAEIFVDGVRAVRQPILLPRSRRVFVVRVSAPGHHPELVQVSAERSSSISVRLKRRARP